MDSVTKHLGIQLNQAVINSFHIQCSQSMFLSVLPLNMNGQTIFKIQLKQTSNLGIKIKSKQNSEKNIANKGNHKKNLKS